MNQLKLINDMVSNNDIAYFDYKNEDYVIYKIFNEEETNYWLKLKRRDKYTRHWETIDAFSNVEELIKYFEYIK